MKDLFKREIKYLRISLTELCNLRCRYCMPMEGVFKKKHEDMLTQEEIITAVRAATKLGINKIRLTGGEPLLKKNIVEIVSKIRDIDGVEEICLTTNGTLLSKYAKDLKSAGLTRVNISLDTLNKEKFKYITRIGELKDTLSGIDAALAEDFKKIKLNTVLIGGFNDDEIVDIANLTLKQPTDVRFIELMPMYDSGDFKENAFISYKVVIEKLKEVYKDGFIESERQKGSVARLYKIKNAKANIGLINPVTDLFCSECNRIRLTADGMIKPCLHSNKEIPIKGLDENEMVEKFKEAIYMKPEKHPPLSYDKRSKVKRRMNQIGG